MLGVITFGCPVKIRFVSCLGAEHHNLSSSLQNLYVLQHLVNDVTYNCVFLCEQCSCKIHAFAIKDH